MDKKENVLEFQESNPARGRAGKLSFVIPCFNESTRLGQVFSKLSDFNKQWDGDLEIMFVDDGSTDGTPLFLEQIVGKLISEQNISSKLLQLKTNQGKGAALKNGVAQTTGDHILTIDADMSMDPLELIRWLNLLPNRTFPEKAILIASRNHKQSTSDTSQIRRLAGLVFNLFMRAVTNLKVSDSQCGFKLYPGEIGRAKFSELESNGWVHDVEILYSACLDKITIMEMPVNVVNHEGSKVSLVRDSIRMFIQVIIITAKVKWRFVSKNNNF